MKKSEIQNGFIKSFKVVFYVYLSFLNVSAFSQSKRALIVAIGNYAPETKWGSISSANDVPILKETLNRQGFQDIEVITDELATKKGVDAKFEELLNRTQKDDIIYIHFSTHGQQIEDLNGDEVDGFDEAIICYDSPKEFSQGYIGERHFTDDELAQWILKLRQKAGNKGDILLMADACHSGTVSRAVGTQKVRGGAAPLSLTGKEIKTSKSREAFLSTDENQESSRNDLAPYAIISAASANQLNYEVMDNDFNTYGSLSYTFNKVINQANSNETYRSLFAKIQSEMKVLFLSQTPEIAGTLDRKIWAGAEVEELLYFGIIESDLDLERDEIEINGGDVHGITVGSKIELYPIGNYISEEDKPAYEGVVERANMFNAIVKLHEPLDGGKKFWAYVSERAFGEVFTNVGFSNVEQLNILKESLNESRLIRLTNDASSELIIEKTGTDMVQIINTGTTAPLGEPIDIDLNLSTVKTRIENYTKSKFLLSFNPESSDLEARLEMVPATSNFLKDTISIDKFIENGVITMDTNTSFFLKVVNESDQKIYYNIVDIDAENWISVVLPDSEDSNGDDYWVEPLSETIVSRDNVKLSFQAIPPFGSETMKLFISDMPIDLRGLSNQKSRSLNPNPLSALEKIFDFSGKKGTRSIEPSYSNKFKATSYSLNFQIVPAN